MAITLVKKLTDTIITTIDKILVICAALTNLSRSVELNLCTYSYKYGTAQLQLHFYTRVHVWHHAAPRVEHAKISHRNYYLHETGNAMTRHVVLRVAWLIPRVVVIASTYIDSRQKSVTWRMVTQVRNCITRGMTILYFQLTLYIAGIATGIVRS